MNLQEDLLTRKMLNTIREGMKDTIKESVSSAIITEDAHKKEDGKDDDKIVLNRDNKLFGDVAQEQEEKIKKTLNVDVEFESDALVYVPSIKDLIINGKISKLKASFQFRHNDPSGEGCYLWADELQLTESNVRVIGKLYDAYAVWDKDLISSDLLERLGKEANKQ